MTAEEELASKYKIQIQKGAGGVLQPYAWTEQNGSMFAPVSVPANSEMAILVDRALENCDRSR